VPSRGNGSYRTARFSWWTSLHAGRRLGAVVEDEGQTPVRAADVDVKKTAVGAFELVGVGHVDKVVMSPPGSQGKPTSSTQRSQGIRST
jgi:hypothetical protein